MNEFLAFLFGCFLGYPIGKFLSRLSYEVRKKKFFQDMNESYKRLRELEDIDN